MGNVITNRSAECEGVPCKQGFVLTSIRKDKDFAILHTSNITYCTGIGAMIMGQDQRPFVIAMFHSISEHEHELVNLNEKVAQYGKLSWDERNNCLKSYVSCQEKSLADQRGSGPEYFICAMVQLFSVVSSGDAITVMLYGGDDVSLLKVARAREAITKIFEEYIKTIELKDDISLNFKEVKFDAMAAGKKNTSFFAIDSTGKSYTSPDEYDRYLLIHQIYALKNNIESALNSPSIPAGRIYDELFSKKINLDGREYVVPLNVKTAYKTLKKAIMSIENQGQVKVDSQYLESMLSKSEKALLCKKENEKVLVSVHAPPQFFYTADSSSSASSSDLKGKQEVNYTN
ncbi:hypothetical protein L3V79_03495 [Thiotrichales bacterium 19S9-12]|nr:hypothetical protein [Thiotrichales bacterium 19S9-11]MCF6811424.1 hypothetical protein [Thiotrichales bacterium 19S9-12]